MLAAAGPPVWVIAAAHRVSCCYVVVFALKPVTPSLWILYSVDFRGHEQDNGSWKSILRNAVQLALSGTCAVACCASVGT